MNVLLEALPEEWNGYIINTDFRVGIRISLALEDPDLFEEERFEIIVLLLFQNDDGSVRPHPQDVGAFEELLTWFLSGWNMDGKPKERSKQKLVDYNVDQWRIFADFRQVYGIDLSKEKMHFWAFCGLLWSLPSRQSSFLQVIEIRRKKPGPKASAEEKAAIEEAHRIYGLDQQEEEQKLTPEDEAKIDAFDRFRGK